MVFALLQKLTFDKFPWKLHYSRGGGGSQNLLVIHMIWWHHGIPENKLYEYFPRGLLSLLPTFAYLKIPSETSFLRTPRGKEMSLFWSGFSSDITFLEFHLINCTKEAAKRRPRNRQRNPNWGHCYPQTQQLPSHGRWMLVKKSPTGQGSPKSETFYLN